MESLPQERSTKVQGTGPGAALPCDDMFSAATRAEASNDLRMLQLARTIEREIIPRLMIAHRALPRALEPTDATGLPITATEVEHFARLALSADEDAAFAAIAAYRARQVPIEAIYVQLLAPTARYLGHLWEEDLCNFADVTVGLGRLQRVLRELSADFGCGVEHPHEGRRILLLPSPGEQHTFGLMMVAEFFRRAGWDVAGGAWVPGDHAGSLVGSEWFDVVGFSLAAEIHLDALKDIIRSVRHVACNRDVAVLVGGPMFGVHPEYVEMVGADGMTIDGRQAPLLAEALVAQGSSRRSGSGADRRLSCGSGVTP